MVPPDEMDEPAEVAEQRAPDAAPVHPQSSTAKSESLKCAVKRLETHVTRASELPDDAIAQQDTRVELVKRTADLVAAHTLLVSLILMPETAKDGAAPVCERS
jgi:hypothetical protein